MPEQGHPLNALRRLATVNSATSGPNPTVNINIGGDASNPVDVSYLDSYSPTTGDVVVVMSIDGDHIVLGSIAMTPDRLEVFSGNELLGTYDDTKPIRHLVSRRQGTSDGTNGLASGAVFPTETTAVLSITFGMNFVAGHTIIVRTDLSTLTLVRFQLRNSASPFGGLINTVYDFNIDAAYQCDFT
jgi:hypothetical protein